MGLPHFICKRKRIKLRTFPISLLLTSSQTPSAAMDHPLLPVPREPFQPAHLPLVILIYSPKDPGHKTLIASLCGGSFTSRASSLPPHFRKLFIVLSGSIFVNEREPHFQTQSVSPLEASLLLPPSPPHIQPIFMT